MTASFTIVDGYLVIHLATTRRPRLRVAHWRAIAIDNTAGGPQNWLAYDKRRHRPVVVLGESPPALTEVLELAGARLIAHDPARSTYLVPRRLQPTSARA